MRRCRSGSSAGTEEKSENRLKGQQQRQEERQREYWKDAQTRHDFQNMSAAIKCQEIQEEVPSSRQPCLHSADLLTATWMHSKHS